MSYKQKNIGVVIGFIVLLLSSYVFSIQKTIDLKTRLEVLKKDKEWVANAGKQLFNLQQENKYLEAILKKQDVAIENSFQQTLLKKINSFAHAKTIEIISFEEPHQFTDQNTKLMTYTFQIKGTFNSLLQLLNFLEKQQLGAVLSVNMIKKKNYSSNKETLIGQFYMQQLEELN